MTVSLLASISTSQAVTTMQDLQSGGSIASGGLLFSNFSNITQMGDLNVALSDIAVVPISTAGNDGIRFQTAMWALVGAPKSYDLAFDFQVSAVNSGETIAGNSLLITGSPNFEGHARIAETVTDLSTNSLASELVFVNQVGTGSNQLSDSSSFTSASQTISVHKDFAMTTTGSNPSSEIFVSHFDQTFVVVPEPSSFVLMGVGAAGLALMRRRQARK